MQVSLPRSLSLPIIMHSYRYYDSNPMGAVILCPHHYHPATVAARSSAAIIQQSTIYYNHKQKQQQHYLYVITDMICHGNTQQSTTEKIEQNGAKTAKQNGWQV